MHKHFELISKIMKLSSINITVIRIFSEVPITFVLFLIRYNVLDVYIPSSAISSIPNNVLIRLQKMFAENLIFRGVMQGNVVFAEIMYLFEMLTFSIHTTG